MYTNIYVVVLYRPHLENTSQLHRRRCVEKNIWAAHWKGILIVEIFIVVGIIAVVIIGWIIATTNNFKKLDIKAQEALSGIEVALEKRYDMLTKMLDTSKAYMKHETEVFTKTVELRRGMDASQLQAADEQIEQLQSRFFAVAENYPQMLSSNIFMELQHGIQDAEAHLQAARRVYNVEAAQYNTAIAMFPASLLAGSRTPKDFFKAQDQKRADVKMNFDI